MTATPDWNRVRRLFHEALDLPPEARLAFVKGHAGDSLVFQEVVSLLESYPAADGFLSTPPDSRDVAAAVAHLQPGDRLGSFEVLGLIGAGGMGEVYRARDTRLDREVAIKVLSSGFANDGTSRERLEREARAIAKLTHPRISTLHDVGTARIGGADATYLVLELVDGETLAARLRRGPLAVDQALAVAIDVAEALAAAHAAGIVHRDLKPANVMLTRSGAKLLDFGLAHARPSPAVTEGTHAVSDDPLTREGVLVGTLPYMSPEQLKGGDADARSDLFAFGSMLYEMITGSRAFDGASQADLIAAIVDRDPPPLSTRTPDAPAALERLVATCLAKDPEDRWQTAKDLVRELKWQRDDRSTRDAPVLNGREPSRRTAGVVAALAITLLAAVVVFMPRAAAPSRISFPVYPPEGTTFPRGTAEMAVSPDGSRLVFVALSADGTRHLWLRRFDAVESRLLDGSDGAQHPFWSADGRAIGFFAHHKLLKIAATGGAPQVICEVALGPRGGTWNNSGTIVFSAFGQGLQRVSDAGGVPRPATAFDPSGPELTRSFPVFLPDGRRFLYLSLRKDAADTAVFQGSLDSMETRRLFASESNVGVAGRYLLSLNKSLLLAQTYDRDRVQTTGSAITIAEGVVSDPAQRSGGAFSVADGGVLAFRSASPNSHLIWFDRNGNKVGAFAGAEGDYHHPWLSPDEKSAAIEKTDPTTGRHTIWTLDLIRGTSSRLLMDPSGAHRPGWSRDGRHVVFSSNRHGGVDLYRIHADGTGQEELLLRSTELFGVTINDWTADGRFLLYQIDRHGQVDLAILPLTTDRTPQPLLDSTASERQGQFSPDGKWLAYTSDESGSHEVYVRRFPGTGTKWQVSTRGGAQGRWRGDGRELFYLAPDGKLMAVSVKSSSTSFEVGTPRALFNTGITGSFVDRFNQYVVMRDGQRFLVNISDEDTNPAPITVVMNWNAAGPQ